MNVVFWIVQILLALHTLIGAVWKFSKTAEQTMPSLAAIPQTIWMAMSMIEILCAVALIIPAFKSSFAKFAPVAAAVIALEMLCFCGIHIASGNAANVGPMIYWLVVAAFCGFIFWGRRRAANV